MLSLLLKIDIAKAFDSVSWQFLLEVLRHMGFGDRWRDWISAILSTASTKILLNGETGRRICHARGLRQGDLLSPMLFVLVMESINHAVRWMDDSGYLSGLGAVGDVQRVSLYVDDMVLFVAPREADLRLIKADLEAFSQSLGLFRNMNKSIFTPLHCGEAELALVHDVLACHVETFLSRYLGIPLSIFNLRRMDDQPLIDMVAARIPKWKGNMLNVAGRTMLAQSTLSAIPVHMATMLCLSTWSIERIDKLRRGFNWSGDSTVAGGRSKLAWKIVCLPKHLGGGVIDLRRMGLALRLRWPWLWRIDQARPWQGLPDDDNRVSQAFFLAATVSMVGNGESTLFWVDSWLDGTNIRIIAPTVFAVVPKRRRHTTVPDVLNGSAWVQHIAGAPSWRLIAEFDALSEKLQQVVLVSGVPGMFTWRLTADMQYSVSSAYGAMFMGCSSPLGARQLWKTSAPNKVKFFLWLAMHGRYWTGHRRWRHGLQDNVTCISCDQQDETIDHILITCVYSREVWSRCLSVDCLQDLVQVSERPLMQWWIKSRKVLHKPIRRAFDSIFFLIDGGFGKKGTRELSVADKDRRRSWLRTSSTRQHFGLQWALDTSPPLKLVGSLLRCL